MVDGRRESRPREPWAVHLPVLTNSRAKAFRRCPRFHFHSYVLGYAPIECAAPLTFGDCTHKGLEAWWRAVQRSDDALAAVLEAPRVALSRADLGVYDRIRAEELLVGYHARWLDEPLEVLAVEVEFDAPLIDPITGAEHPRWRLRGKLDAVANKPGVGHLIVEHKTSSEDFGPGAPYWQRLLLDSQVSTYFAGARALGFEPVGCLYDVIGKAPDLDPRLATPSEQRKYTKDGKLYSRQHELDETADEYRARVRAAILGEPSRFYARGEVIRFPSELEAAALDAWQTAELIDEAIEHGRHPRNVDGCFAYRRACEFHAVCAHGASLDDAGLYRKKNRLHEELGGEPDGKDGASEHH